MPSDILPSKNIFDLKAEIAYAKNSLSEISPVRPKSGGTGSIVQHHKPTVYGRRGLPPVTVASVRALANSDLPESGPQQSAVLEIGFGT